MSITFRPMTDEDYMGYAGADEGATIASLETSTNHVDVIAQTDGQLQVTYMNESGDIAAWYLKVPTQRCAEVLAAGINYESDSLADFGFDRIA